MTKLHTIEWGQPGHRVAVLIHGLTSDSGTWTRVGPALAERGYHVVAPDLLGHGQSPRGPYPLEALTDTLADAIPKNADVIIAHSLGGLLAARSIERTSPKRAVYVDPAWAASPPGVEHLFRMTKHATLDDLKRTAPRWSDEGHRTKLAALGRWDPETLAFVPGFPGYEPAAPQIPSLVLLADPSIVIPPERAVRLRERGFTVRTVPAAGHVIHQDDMEGFFEGLRDWI